MESVSLADLSEGKPVYDVCRVFLASLQLANLGNIDFVTDNGEAPSGDVLDLHEVKLRFRSAEKVRFDCALLWPFFILLHYVYQRISF